MIELKKYMYIYFVSNLLKQSEDLSISKIIFFFFQVMGHYNRLLISDVEGLHRTPRTYNSNKRNLRK